VHSTLQNTQRRFEIWWRMCNPKADLRCLPTINVESVFWISVNELSCDFIRFVVDISGSMGQKLSSKSEVSRIDTACAMAILIREVCERASIYATAGNDMRRVHATKEVPARRGFALADAVKAMNGELGGGGIFLTQCMDFIHKDTKGKVFDRAIVITDEQDCDTKLKPSEAKMLGRNNYLINISTEKNGIGYGNGWVHIDGFSEACVDYIREYEAELQSQQ
jgi:hypothetical protein